MKTERRKVIGNGPHTVLYQATEKQFCWWHWLAKTSVNDRHNRNSSTAFLSSWHTHFYFFPSLFSLEAAKRLAFLFCEYWEPPAGRGNRSNSKYSFNNTCMNTGKVSRVRTGNIALEGIYALGDTTAPVCCTRMLHRTTIWKERCPGKVFQGSVHGVRESGPKACRLCSILTCMPSFRES